MFKFIVHADKKSTSLIKVKTTFALCFYIWDYYYNKQCVHKDIHNKNTSNMYKVTFYKYICFFRRSVTRILNFKHNKILCKTNNLLTSHYHLYVFNIHA